MSDNIVGVIKKLDKCGRISIPIEYREYLKIEKEDEVTITLNVKTKEILVKKFEE